MRVDFHENDGNHENDDDNSDSYKQGVECWISKNHRNHGNEKNHGNPGAKPRIPHTAGLEMPEQEETLSERGASLGAFIGSADGAEPQS